MSDANSSVSNTQKRPILFSGVESFAPPYGTDGTAYRADGVRGVHRAPLVRAAVGQHPRARGLDCPLDS